RAKRLVKVAFVVQQAHAHKGQTKVAGRFEMITRKHAEAARIVREAFREREFERKVGDDVLFGRPGHRYARRTREVAIERLRHAREVFEKAVVRREFGQTRRRSFLEDPHRVVLRRRPRRGVDPFEQRAGIRAPRPEQVFSDRCEGAERLRQRRFNHERPGWAKLHTGIVASAGRAAVTATTSRLAARSTVVRYEPQIGSARLSAYRRRANIVPGRRKPRPSLESNLRVASRACLFAPSSSISATPSGTPAAHSRRMSSAGWLQAEPLPNSTGSASPTPIRHSLPAPHGMRWRVQCAKPAPRISSNPITAPCRKPRSAGSVSISHGNRPRSCSKRPTSPGSKAARRRSRTRARRSSSCGAGDSFSVRSRTAPLAANASAPTSAPPISTLAGMLRPSLSRSVF